MAFWGSLTGETIAGKYRLCEVLGEGGFGVVFSADELVPDRPPLPVALKLILPHYQVPRAKQLEELAHNVALCHPGIMQAYTVGHCAIHGLEMLYLVMERADGSLAQRLAEGPLSLREAEELAENLAAALAYLHAPPRRLVHCDVKPANILRVGTAWKLADFGIARLLGPQEIAMGTAFSTARYAPPEAEHGIITPAWDCWSLGVVLAEAVTGQCPEYSDGRASVADGLSALFSRVLTGCLHSEPAKRWTADRTLNAFQPERIVASNAGDAPAHNLPTLSTRFIGRRREQQEVNALLRRERLVTLTGAGGVGKTRLALEAAAGSLNRYRDGVWLAQLAPLRDPVLVAPALAAALCVPVSPGEAALDAILAFLAPRRLLLVLDNCEHLLEACAEVARAILSSCPLTRLLVTSREPLHLEDERVYTTPPLACPPPDDISIRVTDFDAVRLLLERARAIRPELDLSAPTRQAIVQICTRLDGIPLALELAATRLVELPPDRLAASLCDRFRLLARDDRAPRDNQQTLHAAIAWSYDLLPPDEQALFRQLAVFQGGWTAQATVDICRDDQYRREQVQRLLGALVAKSLVITRETGAELRYDMLETIREYAVELLAQSGERNFIQARAATFFLQHAETLHRAHVANPFDEREEAPLPAAARESRNYSAAAEWYAARQYGENFVRLRWHVIRMNRNGFWSQQEVDRWQEADWPLACDLSAPARVMALVERGNTMHWVGKIGDDAAALGCHEEAMRLVEECGDRLLQLEARAARADLRARMDVPDAEELLAQAIADARAYPHEEQLAWLLWRQAGLAQRHGELDAARAHCRELLEFTRSRSVLLYLLGLREMGIIELTAGHTRDARAWADTLHEEARVHYLYDLAARSTQLLVKCCVREGKIRTARRICRLVLRENAGIAARRTVCMQAHRELAELAVMGGRLEEARNHALEALCLARETANTGGTVWGLCQLADVESLLDTHDAARAHYQQAIDLIHETGARAFPECESCCLDGLAQLAAQDGDAEKAYALLRRSLELRRVMPHQPTAPYTGGFKLLFLADAARVALLLGESERAAVLLGAVAAHGLPGPLPVTGAAYTAYCDTLKRTRAALGHKAFATAQARGTQLALDVALVWVVNDVGGDTDASA